MFGEARNAGVDQGLTKKSKQRKAREFAGSTPGADSHGQGFS